MSGDSTPTIVPCPPPLQGAGLRLLFTDLTEESRELQVQSLLLEQQEHPSALAGLFVALAGNTVLGAVLARPLAGRAAFVWPVRLIDDDESLADRLLAAACRWCQDSDILLAQSLPADDAQLDCQRLSRGGFRHVADLLYLLCPAREFPGEEPEQGLSFLPYHTVEPGRFKRIVERTYQQSLDCPAIDGMRVIDDVLAGYRSTGVYDPSRWLLVQIGNEDVGCLILSADPHHEHWELTYMGVVPEARGRRLGLAIVRHAQWLAGRFGQQRLVLSVDAANAPAVEMYSCAGFVAWDRRHVLLKPLVT